MLSYAGTGQARQTKLSSILKYKYKLSEEKDGFKCEVNK